MTQTVLHLDASARHDGSVSRQLTDRIIARYLSEAPGTRIVTRDLAAGLPPIDDAWIGANFTPADDRSDAQRETLAPSDALVAELQAADTVVIGMPIYNFGIPASLKNWIDMVARVGVTFRYTAEGPEGLLKGKRAIVAVASGGVEVGSDFDFATGHLRHVLGFLGIDDVRFVRADRLALDPEGTVRAAEAEVDGLAIAA